MNAAELYFFLVVLVDMIGFMQAQHIGVALRQNDKHPIQIEAALCLLLVVPINLRPVLTHALFQVR
jgi:hypothetical protein